MMCLYGLVTIVAIHRLDDFRQEKGFFPLHAGPTNLLLLKTVGSSLVGKAARV